MKLGFINCVVCKKEFFQNAIKAKYCSRACRPGGLRKPPAKADCINCGVLFTKIVYSQKYCTDLCRRQYRESKNRKNINYELVGIIRKERLNKIISLATGDNTLEKIGSEVNLTRERVRQILGSVGIKIKFKGIESINLICKNCSIYFQRKPYIRTKSPFCSTLCGRYYKNTHCFSCKKEKPLSRKVNRCKECQNTSSKIWRDKNKYEFKIIAERAQRKYPEKTNARQMLNWGVKSGKIKKPINCGNCGAEKKLDGHHPDYSKPLEVLWLCRSCHANLHWELKNSPVQNSNLA